VTALTSTADGSADAIVTVPPGGAGTAWVTDALRVLKPGGHLVTFGGDSWHRLAVAVEDAGFEVRDSIAALTATGFSPVILARKPLVGTVAANVLAHGTGALNIDATRVGTSGGTARDGRATEPSPTGWSNMRGHGVAPLDKGRWPTNVVLDPVVAAALDEQSGTLAAGNRPSVRNVDENRTAYGEFGGQAGLPSERMDSGGASRFFPVHSSRADLLAWLTRLVTPAGGTVLDPFADS